MGDTPNQDTLDLIDAFGAYVNSDWNHPDEELNDETIGFIRSIVDYSATFDSPLDYGSNGVGGAYAIIAVCVVGVVAYKVFQARMAEILTVAFYFTIIYLLYALVLSLYYEYINGICL